MSLQEELEQKVKARGKVTQAIEEKTREREEVRRRKNAKKKRDPEDEKREKQLDAEIDRLAGEERVLTKRISELKDRDEKLHKQAEELRKEIQAKRDAKPDFDGQPSNVSADVAFLVKKINEFGGTVTSTTGGSHATNSYHYPGWAVDCGGPAAAYAKFQAWCAERPECFRELIGPDNSKCVSYGSRYTIGEGTALESLHDNHTHAAPYPGAFS